MVLRRAFFWGEKFQTTAKSPHFYLHNEGNKLMSSVWQDYRQRLSKDIECEVKAIRELFLQTDTWKIPKAGSICLLRACNEVISGCWTSINLHLGLERFPLSPSSLSAATQSPPTLFPSFLPLPLSSSLLFLGAGKQKAAGVPISISRRGDPTQVLISALLNRATLPKYY